MTTLSAIDIGYNAVKCMATNGRRRDFPSVVGTERKATFSLDEAKRDETIITMSDGKVWYVGHTALKKSDYTGGRRDPDWIFQESYHVLLCAALSELHKTTTTTSVVTGLPIEHYSSLVGKAKEVFVGKHTFKRNGGNWQTVTIENALVITQPYGSLLNLSMADNGRILDNVFSTGVVGIADIGGMTLNLLVTDALDEVGRWTQGDGLGLLKALDAIARDIRADHPGFSPKAREVAGWLAKGSFPYQDKEVDITPYADPHLTPLVSLVLDRVSEVWDEPARYAAVLLTGGGSIALGPAIKARMDGVFANVTIAEDAAFANVRGYLKLARRLWEQ